MIIGNQAVFQINRQFIGFVLRFAFKEFLNLFFRQPNRQITVLKTVVIEDIRETGRKNDPESIIINGPGSMFPAGTAAKIPASE